MGTFKYRKTCIDCGEKLTTNSWFTSHRCAKCRSKNMVKSNVEKGRWKSAPAAADNH